MTFTNKIAQVGRILIIAGSDPSGGAGIQADIKTVTALGGYAAAAITALTVQNTCGVKDIMPVPDSFVEAQTRAVLSDVGADCVKTGMLHDAGVIETVADLLSREYEGQLVVDPVMVATSGDRLLQEKAVDVLKNRLLPLATVVTPNVPEAEVLTGLTIKNLADMRQAASAILTMGPLAVVIKGGHMEGPHVTDMCLVADDKEYTCTEQRKDTTSTHGTGCTFASAMATLLARGESIQDAFEGAHKFVQMAIAAAPGLGQGNGPLGHASVRDI